MSHHPCSARSRRLLAAASLLVLACGESVTGPAYVPDRTVSGPPLEIRAVSPEAAPRGTTLDVLISGSGYVQGATATWALDGDTDPAVTGVRTNSTTFLSSRELIANITIAEDAPLEVFDVRVSSPPGKKGVGLERIVVGEDLFEVTVQATLLPTLGGPESGAHAINDDGVIVGWSIDGQGRFHAVKWTRANRVWRIERLPGTADSRDRGANDVGPDGTAVGIRGSFQFGGAIRATAWPAQGGVVDLGPGFATVIGAGGDIVGTVDHQAVVWNRTGPASWSVPRPLPGFPGGAFSQAFAVDATGTRAYGHAGDADGVERAVRWDLVGDDWQGPFPIPDGVFSAAIGVDASSGVVGNGFPCEPGPGCNGQALYWPPGGARRDLGEFGLFFSHARAINASGDVVGQALTEEFRAYALFWRPLTGTVLELAGVRGQEWYEARDINNRGQAVGESWGARGRRAILWEIAG